MKKILTTMAIVAIIYSVIIKRVTVNAGEEAVIIKKPWFWGEKGVESKTISTGTIWAVASSEIYLIPLNSFSIEDSFSNLLTYDNVPVDFNMTFVFKHIKGKGATLIENFGEDNKWYKSILSKPIYNTTEIAIKKQLFNKLYHDKNVIKELEKDILFGVKALIKERAIPIKLIEVIIDKISPPKEIIDFAIQREVEKEKIVLYKLQKKVEETSAEADRAYMIKMNMTPREYLQMRQIELDTKKLVNERYAIDHAKDSNGSIKIEINIKR